MGNLVGDASEHEAAHATHAPVTDHDEVGTDVLGDADQGVSHVGRAGIVHLDGYTLAFSLGEQRCTAAFSMLSHLVDLELTSTRIGESRLDRKMNYLNGVQLGP